MSEAALYPNSRTWQSSQGVYQVAVMNETSQPYISPTPGTIGFMDVPNATQLALNTDRLCLLPTGVYVTPTAAHANCQHLYAFDVSGGVISNSTGFSQQLQITVKYFIERIPTQSDQNLLVLCSEPAPFDPLVLEIYSRIMEKLPVAVPVGENPLGEWFESVMDVISTALPTIGTALSPVLGPGAAALGATLGFGAGTLKNWNREAREAELVRRAEQSAKDKAESEATKTLRPSTAVTIAANGPSSGTIRRPAGPTRRPPAPKRS